MRIICLIFVLCITSIALAKEDNPIPVEPGVNHKGSSAVSDSSLYDIETVFKKKYRNEAEKRKALEDELARKKKELATLKTEASKPSEIQKNVAPSSEPPSVTPIKKKRTRRKMSFRSKERSSKKPKPAVTSSKEIEFMPFNAEKAVDPLVFATTAATAVQEEMTVIPLGSYVKARILTGVEANAQEPYPMLLQLDYAFTGPNKTKIDLSHCFMIVKTKANLSTERVIGETQEISCVRENGEHFKKAAKGYIAGEDSTFGLTGQLISNQGQVLLTAVLANLAKGAGEAVALANSSQQVISGIGGTTEKATNVTSQIPYIAGNATADAASTIAQWYLEHARQLVPSIAVGSGRDIWIVLLDTIEVPPLAEFE